MVLLILCLLKLILMFAKLGMKYMAGFQLVKDTDFPLFSNSN